MSDDLAALAADAYIYGFALVYDLQMVGGQAEMGMIRPGPFNTFSHASRLAGPDDRFVSINNDTIYSIAQIDVSGGLVLLRVPDASSHPRAGVEVDRPETEVTTLGRAGLALTWAGEGGLAAMGTCT